jgi:5S rRNA maturation endonuclease (ribonuclease M5)
MRAPAEVRLERFQKLIDRISYESGRGAVIVVEGQRDMDSLRRMGIAGHIRCLQSSRTSTVGFAEGLGTVDDVIVLTDFDRQGVYLAKKLARTLNSEKVHANLVLWRELRRLTRSDIRSIEELPKFYQRLRNELLFGDKMLDRGYEIPILTNGKKPVDYRRLRLIKQHKERRKAHGSLGSMS